MRWGVASPRLSPNKEHPMATVRIAMFSRTDIDLSITTLDRVGWTRLSTDESPPVVEVKEAGTWQVRLERGVIYGFATDFQTEFLHTQLADVYFTNAKDPWPKPPPPPPPPYWNLGGFSGRFENFLQTGAAGKADPPIAKIVIQPAPPSKARKS
jgi:hypothetical protein